MGFHPRTTQVIQHAFSVQPGDVLIAYQHHRRAKTTPLQYSPQAIKDSGETCTS